MNTKQSRYESLVKAYHSDVYRYALWLIKDATIAEDIVQETFLRAWKSFDSLKDEAAAKSWLITIVRRENARRFERKQFDTVDVEDVHVEDASLKHEDAHHHRQIRRAISSLQIEYREPLIMQIVLGFDGEEIAKQLNLNKNTVMTRLFRARNQLREVLTSNATIEEANNG